MSNIPTEPTTTVGAADRAILSAMVDIASQAGAKLLAGFDANARPASRDEVIAAAMRNEEIASAGLRERLAVLRPQARWLEEEMEAKALPDGEWWVVDTVEGNVNHVHGLPEWAVTITLFRDRQSAMTVVRQPVGDLTWTAIRGDGAHRNDQRLQVSAKDRLDAAIATTGQAEAGQSQTYRRIGDSISAMMEHALLVRTSVPSTFPMLQVAHGQADLFWQYSPVLSGVAAGILIIQEAGGVVSRLDGTPWQPGAEDILVTTSRLQAEAVLVLSNSLASEGA